MGIWLAGMISTPAASRIGASVDLLHAQRALADRTRVVSAREATPDSDSTPPARAVARECSVACESSGRNLYLSEERSFLRKGREAVYTYFLERELTKKRILELYLNVIEWGDGVYGAEAASRTYFKKSASDLTQSEAAFLAAIIPSPLNVFNPKKNPKRVARRQRVIMRGMNSIKLAY